MMLFQVLVVQRGLIYLLPSFTKQCTMHNILMLVSKRAKIFVTELVSQSYRHVVRVGSLSAGSLIHSSMLSTKMLVCLYTCIIGMLRVWYREETDCGGSWSK